MTQSFWKNTLSDFGKPIVYITFIFILLSTVASILYIPWGEQQYSLLSKSFLVGKTYFLQLPQNLNDSVPFQGRWYWPLGPLPAVLLTIPAYLGVTTQGPFQLLLVFLILTVAYILARQNRFSKTHTLILSFGFVFSSVLAGIVHISWSWYLVSLLAVFLSLLSLAEYFSARRWWIIGILAGMILCSRFTAGLIVLFYIPGLLFDQKSSLQQRFSHLLQLFLPILVSGILLLSYNYVRFGQISDNGYARAVADSYALKLKQVGLFRLENIPFNFYSYFLKTPDLIFSDSSGPAGQTSGLVFPFLQVKYPGVSFLLTSPIFLYFLFKLKKIWSNNQTRHSLLVTILIVFILLTYYWPGWYQVGPRYMADVLPLLYLLLLKSQSDGLTKPVIAVIFFSSLFNFFLNLTRSI